MFGLIVLALLNLFFTIVLVDDLSSWEIHNNKSRVFLLALLCLNIHFYFLLAS